jgi:hypothetical protein
VNATFLRPAIITVIALDLAVLAAFSVRLESRTITTTTPGASAQVAAPVTVPNPVVPQAPPVIPAAVLGSGGVPLGPEPSASPSSAPSPSAGPSVSPVDPTTPPDEAVTIARCPIKIKEPTTSGGLQSLIGFAPAFGPFKAEAFAAASAYQPLLQLIGPILAKYPEIAPKIEPAMAPFLQAFAGLLDTVYDLISPVYSPYRQQVLEAETKLATALAPYAESLVASPLGGCVVELQAALLEDTSTTGSAQVLAKK